MEGRASPLTCPPGLSRTKRVPQLWTSPLIPTKPPAVQPDNLMLPRSGVHSRRTQYHTHPNWQESVPWSPHICQPEVTKTWEKLPHFLLKLQASLCGMEHFAASLKGYHFSLFSDQHPATKLDKVHPKTLHHLQEAMQKPMTLTRNLNMMSTYPRTYSLRTLSTPSTGNLSSYSPPWIQIFTGTLKRFLATRYYLMTLHCKPSSGPTKRTPSLTKASSGKGSNTPMNPATWYSSCPNPLYQTC